MNQVTPRWEGWLKLASIVCTCVVVPGIGWAFSVQRHLNEITGQVTMLSSQMEADRRGVVAIVEELRSLRTSVDSLRSDLLQRITRVETKLEQNR